MALNNTTKLSRIIMQQSSLIHDVLRPITIAETFTSRSDNYDQALSDYTAAIRIDPWMAPAYNNRAFVFNVLGSIDLSAADRKMAQRCQIQNSDVYFGQGIDYLTLQQYEQAIEAFSASIRLDPHSAAYHNPGCGPTCLEAI